MSHDAPDPEDIEDANRPSELRRTRGESVAPPRPLLASEALKEDLAPVEPYARKARVLALGAGAVFGAMGLAPAWNPQGKPWVEVASSACLLAIGGAPLGYALRARLLLGSGIAIGLAGLLGFGPGSIAAYALGEWGVLHFVAASALPTALLFRCHYRAYAIARHLVAAALVVAIPFAVLTASALDDRSLWVEVTSGVALASLGASLLGFSGSQTPLPAGWLASLVVAAMLCPILAHAGERLGLASPLEWLSATGSACAFAAAAGAVAVGAFQVLAMRHWTRARSVDVHPHGPEPPPAAPSAPSLTDTWDDRR